MAASRIEVFEQMLVSDPNNTMVLFGLAKEYEKASDDAKLIETLEKYLAVADDEGNAYGMLARAYERTKQTEKATHRWRMVTREWRKSIVRFWKANFQRRRAFCQYPERYYGRLQLNSYDPVATAPGSDTGAVNNHE